MPTSQTTTVPRPTNPGRPDPIPDWSDEEAEVIGALLWAQFARSIGTCTIDRDVVEKGRELTRGYVRKNVVEQPTFPIDETLECARKCGEKSAAAAGPGNAITP